MTNLKNFFDKLEIIKPPLNISYHNKISNSNLDPLQIVVYMDVFMYAVGSGTAYVVT